MKIKTKREKPSIISNTARIIMLAAAVISTITAVFPALLVVIFLEFESSVDPLEPGIWAYYVLVANLAVLSFAILYYKNSLPKLVNRGLNFILNFDVSQKIALIVIVVILSIYISLSYEELFLNEQAQWGDFLRLKLTLEGWPFNSQGHAQLQALVVKNFLVKVSETVFQNVKIVPFLGTISLLLVSYFFTVQLTKKRFPGLVAVVLILSSYTFLRYDTTASYANFWTLFYVLSLYLLNKKWSLSAISFILSVFSKTLTVAFLPLSFFYIYNTKFQKKKKPRIIASYMFIVILIIGAAYAGTNLGIRTDMGIIEDLSFAEFVQGFAAWSYQLRFDYLLFMFYLPLTVGLILVARSGLKQADSILVLMGGTLLAAPLLSGVTGFNIFPYRYIPFIVFFAIGVGVLLSRRVTR